MIDDVAAPASRAVLANPPLSATAIKALTPAKTVHALPLRFAQQTGELLRGQSKQPAKTATAGRKRRSYRCVHYREPPKSSRLWWRRRVA
jgi:hypothetical protein